MFRSRTVFIVGAGASNEVGLPTGVGLRDQISMKLAVDQDSVGTFTGGDPHLFHAVANAQGMTPHKAYRAAVSISDSVYLTRSIDDALDRHADDSDVNLYGKAAIVQSILEAEAGSLLVRGLDEAPTLFRNLRNTWFNKFMTALGEEVRRPNVEQIFTNVAFVVFNYDRCIERFLTQALQALYRMSLHDATTLCATAPIFHVYGKIGPLWSRVGNDQVIEYGQDRVQVDLVRAAANISTYTEQIDGETIASVRRVIADAETLVFLGSAYLKTNLTIIAPEADSNVRRIFGTAKGISRSDLEVTRQDLIPFLSVNARGLRIGTPDSINLDDCTCSELFDRFSKSLTR